jgi:hypothetical protein
LEALKGIERMGQAVQWAVLEPKQVADPKPLHLKGVWASYEEHQERKTLRHPLGFQTAGWSEAP